MPINPFFKYAQNDQNLVDDLTVECIKVTGHEFFYIPRDYFKLDRILGEDIRSQFNLAIPIEAYITNIFKFDGQQDIIAKYGIMNTDRMMIQIARTRFRQEITNRRPEILKPREGDLIYLPMTDSLFEINKAEDEVPFYQLGALTTFTLTLELFTYSQEHFGTGLEKLDEATVERRDYVRKILLKGIYGGDYIAGENVTQSGYTASVHQFVKGYTYSTLYVMDEKGTYVSGVTLAGQYSSAGYTGFSDSYTTTIIPTDPVRDESDGDNLDFERERAKKGIFDTTEKDPFTGGNY